MMAKCLGALPPLKTKLLIRKTVLVVEGKKEVVHQMKAVLGKDFPIRLAGPARKIKAKKQADLIFLPCDFQCSVAHCSAMFKFTFLHRDIPFAIFRFLPLNKRILRKPAFSLSFFESFKFSPEQEQVIDGLRSSEPYSRNLILRLGPSNIVSKVLALQTEIIKNPEGAFDLGKSAEVAGLSPCWLSHKFKEISGITLRSFLIKNHLCLGLWRLTSYDKLIKTIAMELGYKPLPFSERFKEEFGVSPRALRRYLMTAKAPAGKAHFLAEGGNPQKNRYKQK
jgi:AraC-like DNA-binding protein